ncbi:alpha/beta fold hydrolase [Chitinophaga arvensicola]|uniref:Pimeloyl-ACP methyl ester carboxylesterase n=1 Tax=Chitinophaga arvensicola TaxID=29529 RepID=A0A1I0S9H6_9BACT|nr:alpha/beta hydrolase [Chitinophaga arvensicola]SEW52829.1 Pimeloyl-ACP methyl ester carboxylesterase [Chitinophaga arvensicola]
MTTIQGSYAPVNGLQLYYEVHGVGKPLLLLPGALSGIDTAFGKLIPLLAKDRQVIALEFQGYGHTADLPERPLSYEQLAGDVMALLRFLDIPQTDIFGYSTGAGVALRVAMTHPELVRKLILASVSYQSNGRHPDLGTLFNATIMEQMLKGSPFETAYLRTAPRPDDWAKLLDKVRTFEQEVQHWSEDAIRKIPAPALIIAGDADIIQPEHTVSLYRLLGGGSLGELSMPASQLAILPGTMHSVLTQRTDLLMAMIPRFLEM